MAITESEQLWDTVYTLGADDGEPINPACVYCLIELGIAEMGSNGPRLTPYGEKYLVVMESGDGEVPELQPSVG